MRNLSMSMFATHADYWKARAESAEAERDAMKAREESDLPYAYLLAKVAMVIPLLQEARDALPAISEQRRVLYRVAADLGRRMDIAGTYSVDDWRAAMAAKGEK